jgi:hypothetical protein
MMTLEADNFIENFQLISALIILPYPISKFKYKTTHLTVI